MCAQPPLTWEQIWELVANPSDGRKGQIHSSFLKPVFFGLVLARGVPSTRRYRCRNSRMLTRAQEYII